MASSREEDDNLYGSRSKQLSMSPETTGTSLSTVSDDETPVRSGLVPGFLAEPDDDEPPPPTASSSSSPENPSIPLEEQQDIEPQPQSAPSFAQRKRPEALKLLPTTTMERVPQSAPAFSTSSTYNLSVPGPSISSGQNTFRNPRPSFSQRAVSPRSPFKKRPTPLDLKGQTVGLDEEYEVQRNEEQSSASTSTSRSTTGGSMYSEMQDLTALRRSVNQNLLDRPVDSPLHDSISSVSSGFSTPTSLPTSDGQDTINIDTLLTSLKSERPPLLLDTRPLTAFLDCHLPRSANIAIPSLIFKRFGKSSAKWLGGWDSLGTFVSTAEGKEVWRGVDRTHPVDVVIIGLSGVDEVAGVLRRILVDLVKGSICVLQGGWDSVEHSLDATNLLVHGEQGGLSEDNATLPPRTPSLANLTPLASASTSTPVLPPIPPGPGVRKTPSTLAVGSGSMRRTPKLSLNLDKPIRSATLGSFPDRPFGGQDGVKKKSSMLTIDVGESNRNLPTLRASQTASFQTLCHQQSKLPPSPSSFGDIKRLGEDSTIARGMTNDENIPRSAFTARPGPMYGAGSSISTTRNGMAPFIVSTILPSFLYLGPEISSARDVQELQDLGIKRILNVAIECEDDQDLGLKRVFEKYLKVPMRDIVEESGVKKGMRESCNFLDDARLHSAPTYVHCKAGKSRSVTVVLAYLIHANAWTLKTAYAYVAERRKGISPNIGFVAELMQFEESELGLKQSGGVSNGKSTRDDSSESESSTGERTDDKSSKGGAKKTNPRHMRESLPPAWASSVDSGRPLRVPFTSEKSGKEGEGDEGRRQAGEEQEIRKNGQWVHSRRIPVDRATLQPGRRVSKAGLESLRPLAAVSPRPSSPAEDGKREHASTPGSEGRLGWV